MYYETELYHHGIKGQKWGVRRFQNSDGTLTDAGRKRRDYNSTSIGAAIARRQNAKVDKSFKDWKSGSEAKELAIEKGKIASDAKMAYERDPKNKDLKREYNSANREYKKALNANTTYRKGSVREEVGKDLSRKYLSEAKRVEKQLKQDPGNRDLQKQYSRYMSQHDIERAKARRAQSVGASRSYKKAAIKRGLTMAVKTAVTTAAVGAGLKAVDKYVMNGTMSSSINAQSVIGTADSVRKILRYVY